MATFDVPVDPAVLPGLAGPSCVRAVATTYRDSAEPLVERNFQQSRFARIQCFNAANALLGVASIDSQDTLGTAFRGGTLEAVVLAAFGG